MPWFMIKYCDIIVIDTVDYPFSELNGTKCLYINGHNSSTRNSIN